MTDRCGHVLLGLQYILRLEILSSLWKLRGLWGYMDLGQSDIVCTLLLGFTPSFFDALILTSSVYIH